MDFKSIVQADIGRVFFSLDEFAETYQWDGAEIRAVIDTNEIQFRYSEDYQAFPSGSLFLFVPVSCFESQPQLFSVHRFNGNVYTIQDVKEEDGVYAILLFYGRN